MLVLGIVGALTGADEAKITAEERAKAIQLLRDSENEFLELGEKLTDAQWAYKPAPSRWSVGEVAEHIALSEGLLFGTMQGALSKNADPEWATKTTGKNELLERLLLNRRTKAQAPEQVQPKGEMPRTEIMDHFKQVRAKTLKFIEQTDLPLKAHTLDHPFPVFGTLNAYQWLVYIPLHNMRHNQQIAEVKADPNFPK